jgi:hypothetical protein
MTATDRATGGGSAHLLPHHRRVDRGHHHPEALKVRAEWYQGYYPTGTQITDAELAALPLKPDKWHGEWNHTLRKQKPELK